MFRTCRTAALGLALALVSSVAAAQSFRAEKNWLGPRGDLNAALTERGRLPLAPLPEDAEQAWLARLGAILFRAPDLFGETARRAGLSCDVCHSGGSANRRFFVQGASGKPGTFDVASDLFNPAAPGKPAQILAIPALGGAARAAPFGHDGRFPALEDFIRHVIVDEFGGDPPTPLVTAALAAFQARLLPPANPWLDEAGRLSQAAPSAARAGEALFARPFPGQPQLSCASCHPAAESFTDRRRHDVGTGVAIDTPSLRRGALDPPFFHDGRFDRMDQVVDHFDRHYGLKLSTAERDDLLAYLHVLRGDGETASITLEDDAAQIGETVWVVGQVLARRIEALVGPVIGVARRELGAMNERFQGDDKSSELVAARAALVELSVGLRAAERAAELREWLAATDLAGRASRRWAELRFAFAAAAPVSLYDPARRRRFLAGQNAN